MNRDTVKKIYCHKFKQSTKQKRLFIKKEVDTREVFFESLKGESRWVIEDREWQIYECLGCDMLNLEIETSHRGNKNTNLKHFPGQVVKSVPPWLFYLDRKYIELLSEVYLAINNNAFRLASMGIRTVIDIFALDHVGDIGSFKSKLKELTKNQYINKIQAELLGVTIDAGSASAHRGYNPSKEVLISIMEIVEHILQTYVLSAHIEKIKKETPPRSSN